VLPTSPLMRTSLSETRSLFPAATGRPRLLQTVPRILPSHIGRDDDRVAQVALGQVFFENAPAAEMVGGHTEEAVHLRGVQHDGHDVGGPGRFKQFSHQPGGDGDARGVLFVGAGKGK
jgi:hypothetical protein